MTKIFDKNQLKETLKYYWDIYHVWKIFAKNERIKKDLQIRQKITIQLIYNFDCFFFCNLITMWQELKV